MAGSDKSNAGGEIKKKTSALDEDFGKDFLWGSPKKGKDKIDFDMGEAPKNKKKPFNFDKLDDFVLSSDFGKLPNFKMNMTDVDFSSPDMNSGKATAKSAEKQKSKKDDFSFNFDFELDKFDFDSAPSKCKSKPNAFKQAMDHDSRSNSYASTDSLKDMEKSKSLDKISDMSKHENMVKSKYSSEDVKHNAMSHGLLSEMKETSISDRNKDKTCTEEGHKKQTNETCFTNMNMPKTTQDFILQSQSNAYSGEEDNQQFAVQVKSAMEKNSSMRTDNSHSKHSIPENSCDSECFPETRMNDYYTVNGVVQSKFEGNKNEIACEVDVPREAYQGQLRVQSSSVADISIARGMTNTEEKQGSGSNLKLPGRKSCSSALKPMSLNDKLASALQKRSLKNSAGNALHHALLAPDSEAKNNHGHAETVKTAITEPYETGPIKEVSNNSSGEKENEQMYPSVPGTMQKIEKMVTFKGRSSGFLIKALSKTASSSLVKSGLASAFLKRKTFEVLPSVPEKLKSLKHDMGSATERKSVNNFQKTENTVPIAVSEMSNTANYNNSGKEVFDVEVHQKDGEIDETTNKTVSISQNISEELNKEDADNGDQHKPPIEESGFIRLCAENINQDTALVLPNETGSSISSKPAAVKEQNDSMSTVGSSHSRNTTPDNSFCSRPNDGENEMLKNNQDLHGDFNQLPLHSNSNPLKVSMKDKAMAIIHCKASDKPGQNAYLKSTPVSDKEASPEIKDLKAPTLSPLRDSRFFKRNQEFISKQNINMLKPNDISSDKGLSVAKSDTSRVKFRSSNLPDHTKESNTLTSLSTSLVKLNSLMLKSGTAKGTKIAMVAESSPKSPLRKAWINSATEKNDSSAVPMKRKIFEDPAKLNPLKRVMELPAERKLTNVSPKTQSAMVPAAEIFEENVEECVNNLNSTLIPELGGITTGIERLEPYEKDETTIKAEFYRNKLEDVSGRLIKQQEEAKNLLFRVAAGNNSNKQLKQKYQRLDEKIRTVQKFAASLLVKKF